MSVALDMRWAGTGGAAATTAIAKVGPSFTHLSGNNDGVIVAGGHMRVGTANVDNFYECPAAPVGLMYDVSFGIKCLTDLPQDVVVHTLYDTGQRVSCGLRWGSRAQWMLYISGPTLPFGGTILAADVNPVAGRTYICRLLVTPYLTNFYVDGVMIATAEGTDSLGIVSPGHLVLQVSGALTLGNSTGWHVGRIRAVTANPRPAGRDIPTGLAAKLDGGVMRLCYCILVTRGDSTQFGFTTHDRNVVLDSVTYEAMGATQSTNLRQEVGNSPDNMDLTGMLVSSRITEEDLLAGLYDNAEIKVSMCDWSDPTLGSVVLMRGNIGDVTVVDGQFTAGVRSLKQRMQQQTIELVSPTCRVHRLGDARCKVNLAGNTTSGKPITTAGALITSITDALTFELSGIQTEAGFYSYGSITATSGRNAGMTREIKLHSATGDADQRVIIPATQTYNDISYKGPLDTTPSVSPVFSIPTGTWDQASFNINTGWSQRNPLIVGQDQLAIQTPVGGANDVVIRSSQYGGDFTDDNTLGPAVIEQINLHAGSTLAFGIRHTSASSSTGPPYMHINIQKMQLVLLGYANASTSRLVLHEPFPFDIAIGDEFAVVAGCNRLISTCQIKYDNVENIRAEPYTPGTDRLMQRGRAPS